MAPRRIGKEVLTTIVAARVNRAMGRALEQRARRTGVSIGEVVRRAVVQYMGLGGGEEDARNGGRVQP
jgi:hypothetical protein